MFRFVCLLSLCVAAFGLGIGSVQPNTVKFPPSYVQTLQPIGTRILVTNPQTLPLPYPQATANPLAYVVAVGTGFEGELDYIPGPQQRVYADYSVNRNDARTAETNFVREGDIVMLNGAGCPSGEFVNLNRINAIGAGIADYCLINNVETQILGVVNVAQQFANGYAFLRPNQPVNGGIVNEVRISGQSAIEGSAVNPVLTLSLAFPATTPITVTVVAIGGTALNADISPAAAAGTTHTFNFAVGDTTRTLAIPIINDNLAENIEDFNFRIVSASGAVISRTQNVGTISIVDDDTPAVVGVGPSTRQTVAEGGDITFTFTLDRPVAQPVILSIRIEGVGQSQVDRATITTVNADNDVTLPGTFVEQVDGSVTGDVTIPANLLTADIVIPVIDDTRVEFSEGLRITIIGASGSVRIDPNNPTAEATITSDDRATLSVVNAAVAFDEGDANAGFQVQLDRPVPTLFSVILQYSGPAQQRPAGANAGGDYAVAASTTYPANTIAAETFVTPTFVNTAQTTDTSFTVTLGGVTSSLVDIDAGNNQVVVTINNTNP